MSTYDAIVLDGGYLYGLINLRILSKVTNLGSIKKFGGIGIGGLISTLLSIGYTLTEIEAAMKCNDFNEIIFGSSKIFPFSKTTHQISFYDDKNLMCFLKDIVYKKTGSTKTTFAQLKTNMDKELVLMCTGFDSLKSFTMSHSTTPNLEIVKALRMTLSIQFIHQPVCHCKHLYFDGQYSAKDLVNIFATDNTLQLQIGYEVKYLGFMLGLHPSIGDNKQGLKKYVKGTRTTILIFPHRIMPYFNKKSICNVISYGKYLIEECSIVI